MGARQQRAGRRVRAGGYASERGGARACSSSASPPPAAASAAPTPASPSSYPEIAAASSSSWGGGGVSQSARVPHSSTPGHHLPWARVRRSRRPSTLPVSMQWVQQGACGGLQRQNKQQLAPCSPAGKPGRRAHPSRACSRSPTHPTVSPRQRGDLWFRPAPPTRPAASAPHDERRSRPGGGPGGQAGTHQPGAAARVCGRCAWGERGGGGREGALRGAGPVKRAIGGWNRAARGGGWRGQRGRQAGGRRRPSCRGWAHAAPRPPLTLADAHGEVKYNCWEKPTEVAKWKEEHVSGLARRRVCGTRARDGGQGARGAHHLATPPAHARPPTLAPRADCVCCAGQLGPGHLGEHEDVWRQEGRARCRQVRLLLPLQLLLSPPAPSRRLAAAGRVRTSGGYNHRCPPATGAKRRGGGASTFGWVV